MLILSIIVFIIVIVIIIVLIYTCQNYLIFSPDRGCYVHNEIFIKDYISCRIVGNKDKILMYCHGICGNITQIDDFVFDNYSVMFWDYPGFGNSKGKMTLDSFLSSSLHVYDYLYKRYKKVIAYGYSFGSGIAAYVSMMRDTSLVILEAPYYSFNELLYEKVSIISLLSVWNIETYKYLDKYNGQVYKLHGLYDTIIPIHHSLSLKGDLFIFNNDHMNLKDSYDWYDTVQHILNTI